MQNILGKYTEANVSQEEGKENPLEELVDKTEYHVFKGTNRVVCCLHLKKGGSVIAVSDAPVEDDFNEDVGKSIARDRAMDQLSMMENYAKSKGSSK
ncbi:MAG: hypothetical protein IBX57_00275 [Gammaproteobacteria bacterium]|nr:hypothetical protein [Gammaproteobacteria bacterium]